MSRYVDWDSFVGKEFGKLKVVGLAGKDKRGRMRFICECKCGREKIILADSVKSKHTQGCGKCRKPPNKTHGMTNTRIFSIWCGMKGRCLNPHQPKYKDYGGRGITVYQEWLDDFMNFYNWSMENGYSDDLSIDRIDVNGNYEPSNCRWATNKEQSNNKRTSHILIYKNEKHNIAEWSEILGIDAGIIENRLRSGWSVEKTLITPVKKHNKYKKALDIEVKK